MRWLPWLRDPPAPAALLAFDLETSGLDPRRDAILAVGLLPLEDGTLRWGERFEALVADPRSARPRDAKALGTHQILPRETRGGLTLGALLDRLEAATAEGRTLLTHGGTLEARFCAEAARFLGRPKPRLPRLDTLRFLRSLEEHRPHLGDRLPDGGRRAIPTQLGAARAYWWLPPLPAHHALLDALATAELYLLLARRFPELHPQRE